MSLPIEQMLKDVAVVERLCNTPGQRLSDSPTLDLCCHVKALAAEVERKDKALKLVFETVASGFGSHPPEPPDPDGPWLPAGVLSEVFSAIDGEREK